jgi:hypothetical protein
MTEQHLDATESILFHSDEAIRSCRRDDNDVTITIATMLRKNAGVLDRESAIDVEIRNSVSCNF